MGGGAGRKWQLQARKVQYCLLALAHRDDAVFLASQVVAIVRARLVTLDSDPYQNINEIF